MPNITIKTLEEKTGTAGLHMGGGPERRKLQPGEIVHIPDDMLADSGQNLFDVLYATRKVEITPEAPTRPLDFANAREAELTSPTFKITGEDAANEVAQAKQAVAERMANSFRSTDGRKPKESPATEATSAQECDDASADDTPKPRSGRRGTRRASRHAPPGATHGAENSA